jgi:hypothetical protein
VVAEQHRRQCPCWSLRQIENCHPIQCTRHTLPFHKLL